MRIFASPENIKIFRYEMEAITRVFLPLERVEFLPDSETKEPPYISVCGDGERCAVTLEAEGFFGRLEEEAEQPSKARELSACRLLYRLLSQWTGQTPPWGTLTGVRPVKLVRQLGEQGLDKARAADTLSRDYMVLPGRIALCQEVEEAQRPLLKGLTPRDYSLYVSIPFCPSRCSYCSFVSHSVEKSRSLLPLYLDKLFLELKITGEIARQGGLRLHSVYVGGGTPTVLDEAQLSALLGVIAQNFPLEDCREFTVEAGRPDTITPEKLAILARGEVNRLSINPQTLNDDILASIGRNHSSAQFLSAFASAKAYPFTVNVDLIAGLEGESFDSFAASLDSVIALAPGNITVHTLTLKRASDYYQNKNLQITPVSTPSDMVDYSRRALAAGGYRPYYLYRQKNTVDSLENVGYARDGFLCRYNVLIMDDAHPILSAGAGGVSKVILPTGEARRIINHKYPYEYISRFDEVVSRKEDLRALLQVTK